VLLRALDVGRDAAGAIAQALAEGSDSIAEQMAAFDALTRDQALALLQPWQIDTGYRMAIAALAAGIAERGDGWAA
jgi:hypothetical protein